MSKHKTEIEGYTLDELADVLGDLRYDALAEFLEKFSDKLRSDAQADLRKDKLQLSDELYSAFYHARKTMDCVEKAWEISKPHMDLENE